MPFSNLWQVLTRFWYITVIGLILTVALGYAASIVVPAKYQAESRVLLLQKTLAGDAAGSNPYLSISGLTPFADVVSRSMTGTATVQRLKADGLTSGYTVERDLTTNGPVLLVTVTGDTANGAVKDLGAVLASVGPVLSTMQSDVGVPADAVVSAQVITQDTTATVVRKNQIRAMVVGVAAGVFLTVLAAVLFGRWRVRPRRRARRALVPEPATPADRGDAPSDVVPSLTKSKPDVGDPIGGRRRRELAGRSSGRIVD